VTTEIAAASWRDRVLFLSPVFVSTYSRGALFFRQVVRCLFTLLSQFNYLLDEEVQPFEPHALPTLHATEHHRALAIEVAEPGELNRHATLGSMTHLSANLLQ